MKTLLLLSVCVASALAAYQGCWKDDSQRVMDKSTMQSINDQTTAGCINRCAQLKYPLAGTQYARECFCGYDFTRLGRATNCNMKCTGDKDEICGGVWALSVYDTEEENFEFVNEFGLYRIFTSRNINAAGAERRCQLLGPQYQLADVSNEAFVNAIRPQIAKFNFKVTTELYVKGRTPKPHHAILSPADLPNDSGDRYRIISNWPGQSEAWNIYAKDGTINRPYICQNVENNELGCWKDDSARVMVKSTMQSISQQSTESCIERCRSQGYSFAGTQYARECFCGNDFTRLGRADNCNMKCTGNANEICGGVWALSVYRTGL